MSILPIVQYQDLVFEKVGNSRGEETLQKQVSEIISDVRGNGDSAVINLTTRFDRVTPNSLLVSAEDIERSGREMDDRTRRTLEKAIINIETFHRHQVQKSWQETSHDGTTLGEIVHPVDRAGIYVPGGKAFYPSTMLMNTIPAQIAGVPSIMISSPPTESGRPHDLVLGICSMLGLKEVLCAGGAQAIAAMAYGTESIRPVCKITGPGNRYVAEAKRQVFGKVGIDSIAGPSEILIIHDDPEVPVDFLVRDLLTQAEHDEDARSILVTTLPETAEGVQKRIETLVPDLPRREIIKKSLETNGKIILVESIEQAVDVANQIAPEHLELMVCDKSIIKRVRNAGAIFVGKWSTETIGDYFAGPNHTIPTSGAAKFGSPLSVRDFQKHSSLIEYSEARLEKEAEDIIQLARLEGLYAHAEAITARISTIKGK